MGDNHHHIVCRTCGTIEDVDCVVGEAPCLHVRDSSAGMAIDEAEITFWGICERCRAAYPAGPFAPSHASTTRSGQLRGTRRPAL